MKLRKNKNKNPVKMLIHLAEEERGKKLKNKLTTGDPNDP